MIASDPSRSDRRAPYRARRESAAQEKSEAWEIGLVKSLAIAIQSKLIAL